MEDNIMIPNKKLLIIASVTIICFFVIISLVEPKIFAPFSTITNINSSENNSLENWIGDYFFSEFNPPFQNMFFSVSIYKENNSFLSKIFIDGYQTLERNLAQVVGDENSIRFEFLDYLPEKMYEPYKKGDILLQFKKENSKIITIWGKIGPLLLENRKPGVYFEKITKTEKP